ALSDIFLDHSAYAPGCEPAAAAMKEDGLIVTFRFGTFGKKNGTRLFEVIHQGLQCRLAKRHDALLSAFAGHAYKPLAKVDVSEIDRTELADTDPGRVEKLEYRAVAAPEVGVGVGRLDKSNSLFHRKMIRYLALDL